MQDSLTESNYNLFFATAVNVLVRPWESMIRGMKYSEVRILPLIGETRQADCTATD